MSNFRRDRIRYDSDESSRPAIAGIIVGLIAIAALVLIVVRITGDDDGPAQGAPVVEEPSAAPSTAGQESSSVCGLSDGSQAVPTDTPEGLWVFRNGLAAPTSDVYGPGEQSGAEGSAQSCFAHNPVGALFAVANYSVDTASPEVSDDGLRDRMASDSTSQAVDFSDRDIGPTSAQFAGFNIVDYTNERTTLQLVLRSSAPEAPGQLVALTYTVAWERGDWKIVAPQGEFAAVQIPDLSGYVPWGAS